LHQYGAHITTLELVSGETRQLFLSNKGLPSSELMTLFRPCDRAYPSFPSGAEDDEEPYIPCHAYQVPVPRLLEAIGNHGFSTVASVKRDLDRSLKAELRELDRRIEVQSDPENRSIPGSLRKLEQRRRLLQHFTLERWAAAIRRLRTVGTLHRYDVPKPYKGLVAAAALHPSIPMRTGNGTSSDYPYRTCAISCAPCCSAPAQTSTCS